MWYRDTDENDIRRGVEVYLATEKLLRHMGLYPVVDLDFDPDCCLTFVHPMCDLHSSICTIEPQEEGGGYNVRRHGEQPTYKYLATSAAIAAVQMVVEWKVRTLRTLTVDIEDVEEMVADVLDSLNPHDESRTQYDEAGRPD